jgi:hypothetical protein
MWTCSAAPLVRVFVTSTASWLGQEMLAPASPDPTTDKSLGHSSHNTDAIIREILGRLCPPLPARHRRGVPGACAKIATFAHREGLEAVARDLLRRELHGMDGHIATQAEFWQGPLNTVLRNA